MLLILLTSLLISPVFSDYWSQRQDLLASEASRAVGSNITLTPKELVANRIFMNYKLKEFADGQTDPRSFLPAVHFFQSKRQMEKSKVFQLIRRLPKGGSLHSHDMALTSYEYVYNLTYRDDLYVGCTSPNGLKLRFFTAEAAKKDKTCKWDLLSKVRAATKTFDDFLKSHLTIVVEDPMRYYPTINDVWAKFENTFGTVEGLLCYKPVFQDYFYQALQELLEDNVFYLEFRSILPKVYDLQGVEYDQFAVTQMYVDTLARFKRNNPSFLGAKLIYAPYRGVDNKTMEEYVQIALKLKRLHPDFIAGFDLVGQEELGRPLEDFINSFLKLSQNGIKFFFHAGETNWNGLTTDQNLIDAVLLNTTRIGHGYGIVKHPAVLEAIKQKNIALEISPISNQVLKLVDDFRNHPGTFLIANGYPVVISCDDPSFWGARALSYDWYSAFMGFGTRSADLKLLKQLALNSIIYSAMDQKEMALALTLWTQSWNRFIDSLTPSFEYIIRLK